VRSRKPIVAATVVVVVVLGGLARRDPGPKYPSDNPRIPYPARIGWVGIGLDGVPGAPAAFGVPSALRVDRVVAGGPADRAGMRVGDVIVGLNGPPFKDRELHERVWEMDVGDTLVLNVRREGQALAFEMRLVSFRAITELSLGTPGAGIGL
jgi:S1-C subfamily serine protease